MIRDTNKTDFTWPLANTFYSRKSTSQTDNINNVQEAILENHHALYYCCEFGKAKRDSALFMLMVTPVLSLLWCVKLSAVKKAYSDVYMHYYTGMSHGFWLDFWKTMFSQKNKEHFSHHQHLSYRYGCLNTDLFPVKGKIHPETEFPHTVQCELLSVFFLETINPVFSRYI